MPLLSRTLMVRFWSEYFTTDKQLFEAMLSNRHVSSQEAHLFKFANWSTLLPDNLKNNHAYRKPDFGDSSLIKKYPAIFDTRASPLLVEDEKLKGLPLTYVLTCSYDVLRDDGFMYVSRLRQAGVQVVHHHYDGTFHGILLLTTLPFDFAIAHHIMDKYINYLDVTL